MQAIRTIIWVIVAVLITAFALMNFATVSVVIWPVEPVKYVEWPLALVMLVSFAAGFLPPYFANLINRWRLRRRISQHEQTIAQLRSTSTLPPVDGGAEGAGASTPPSLDMNEPRL